ncbi:MAG: M15 family metallopeptidase [Oscillospiraceae bacterium]|nr:M15 family metallopeptidase [Oscillospiraceae bacterium]
MKGRGNSAFALPLVTAVTLAGCNGAAGDEVIDYGEIVYISEADTQSVTDLQSETSLAESEALVVDTFAEVLALSDYSEAVESYEMITIAEMSETSAVSTLAPAEEAESALPRGFVYLNETLPDMILDVKYYGEDNFLGTQVDGYLSPVAILSEKAADALKAAAHELAEQGYALKFFDGYRPQRAVEHFVRWAEDKNDILKKADFYPDIDKSRLIPGGYLARRSAHSRGSAVDLSLVSMDSLEDIDMGTQFDFFGEASRHGSSLITEEQAANRLILKNAMERAGFKPYSEEWWHYVLIDEPFPDTYFDFPIK